MLHLLYILAFTVIAFIAIRNLIRSLLNISTDYGRRSNSSANFGNQGLRRSRAVSHPELLDDMGNVVNEPLLVMRSVSVEDARKRLDDLYQSSPGNTVEKDEEA
ncbi:MAG: DUF2973 domain-containing protein [Chroococcales cyanobacterium]